MAPARPVRRSVEGLRQVPELLADPDRVAVFPERLGRRHAARLTIVPAPLPLPGFTMVAAWHERVHQAPAHQWLREAVVRALAAG